MAAPASPLAQAKPSARRDEKRRKAGEQVTGAAEPGEKRRHGAEIDT